MSRTALAILHRPTHEPLSGRPDIETDPPFRLADPSEPHLSVLDLGATRGDGIFESISISHGNPHALDAHLRRFARSAAILDLPEPDAATWSAAIAAVVQSMDPVAEGFVKIVMTRGIEGQTRSTGWAYAAPSPDYSAARSVGIGVVLLDRGYAHDIETTAPWLLTGAKTLSYALNRAVLREAARRGADDVIFVSSDGFVLEGPTSSVLVRRGNRFLTPGTGLGILDGTTQGDLFYWAEQHDLDTAFALMPASELRTADAVWLVSSGRHAAPVTSIDGHPMAIDRELTRQMNDFLLSRET